MNGAKALTPLEIKFRFWMEWYVAHQPQIGYVMERPSPLGTHLPMVDDCSGTYTNVRYLSGTIDPNGPSCPMVGHHHEYDGFGNTTSLAMFGQIVNIRQLEIGDAVIFYNGFGYEPGNTVHVAAIYELNGENPMTMSHGWSKEPAFVPLVDDQRPHQFFKFPNTLRNPPAKPAPKFPVARGIPTPAQLATANLVGLKNPAHEKIAREHGWTIWYFSEGHTPNPFIPLLKGGPDHIPLYANAAYMMMR